MVKKFDLFQRLFYFSCAHWTHRLQNALIRPKIFFFHSISRWLTTNAEFYADMESIAKVAKSAKGEKRPNSLTFPDHFLKEYFGNFF
jgi:hypothetical protein